MVKDITGKSFENLTTEVFKCLTADRPFLNIQKDVHLDSPEGKRQIDILLVTDIGPTKLKTVIECKDYKRNLNVTHVDALHSKMRDVLANQAVLVTRKGFSGKARKKAQRLGISLFTLNEAKESNWDLIHKAPVLIKEIFAPILVPSFILDMRNKPATTFKKDVALTINDINIAKLFQKLLINLSLPMDPGLNLTWDIREQISAPHFIRDQSRRIIPIQNLKINYKLEESFFWGYLSDLPGTLTFEDAIKSDKTILLESESLARYRKHLIRFSSITDIPVKPIVSLTSIACPDLSSQSLNMKFLNKETGRKFSFDYDPKNEGKN